MKAGGRADAAAAAHDGDPRAHVAARVIVRPLPWSVSTDKIAFISGAAGSIGAATARRFVAEGARVVLSDLEAGALDALVQELGADAAAAAVADVTDPPQVRDAVGVAVQRFGGLDVAFANAGIFGEVAHRRRVPGGRLRARDRGQRAAAPSTSPSTRWRAMRPAAA